METQETIQFGSMKEKKKKKLGVQIGGVQMKDLELWSLQ